MATYMIDQGVNSYRIGYATSVAVILFAVCFVFSILYQFFVLRRDIAGGSTRMAGMTGAHAERLGRTAPFATRLSTSSALALAALVLVPIGYVVLGGFRTTGQLAADPVGLARSRG